MGISPAQAVNVLCDGVAWSGPLSYQVPGGLQVERGDAVKVPFGNRTLVGMVLGPGDPDKATRPIQEVFGKRASVADISHAQQVADRYLSSLLRVASRLAPTHGKGDAPLDAGPLQLAADVRQVPQLAGVPSHVTRRLVVHAPLTSPADVAAAEVRRMASGGGQVLVVCPTVDLVDDVLARFSSGAVRLDQKAPDGAWKGLLHGTATVGVGTRTCVLHAVADLAGIVVVAEDHPAHLEPTHPRTHSRQMAASRTSHVGAQLTLVSGNPTASAIGADVKVFTVGSGQHDWPMMQMVDRGQFPPSERLIPPVFTRAFRRAERDGGRAVVLAESRPSTRLCVRCKQTRHCEQCGRRKGSSCPHREDVACDNCGETDVRFVGFDVHRVRKLVADRADVVTFTELADLQDVGTVVCFDIDPALKRPGFDRDHQAAGVLLSAARAAGRGGTLVVGTHEPDHPLLQDLFVSRDLRSYARRTWQAASEAGLPPFSTVVTVTCPSKFSTSRWPGRVLGPRRKGRLWEALVVLEDHDTTQLGRHVRKLRSRNKKAKVKVT